MWMPVKSGGASGSRTRPAVTDATAGYRDTLMLMAARRAVEGERLVR